MAEHRSALCVEDVHRRLELMKGVTTARRQTSLSQRDIEFLLEYRNESQQKVDEANKLKKELFCLKRLIGQSGQAPTDFLDVPLEIDTSHTKSLFHLVISYAVYKKLIKDCVDKSKCLKINLLRESIHNPSLYSIVHEFASKSKDKVLEREMEKLAKFSQWMKDQVDKPINRKPTATGPRSEPMEEKKRLKPDSTKDQSLEKASRPETVLTGRGSQQQHVKLVNSGSSYQCHLLLLQHPLVKSLDASKQLQQRKALEDKLAYILDVLHSQQTAVEPSLTVNKLLPNPKSETEELKDKISGLEEKLKQEKQNQELLKGDLEEQTERFCQMKMEIESFYSDLQNQLASKDVEIERLQLQVQEAIKNRTQHSILKKSTHTDLPEYDRKDDNNNVITSSASTEAACTHCMRGLRNRRASHVSFADTHDDDADTVLHSSLASTTISKLFREYSATDQCSIDSSFDNLPPLTDCNEHDLKLQVAEKYNEILNNPSVESTCTRLAGAPRKRCYSAPTYRDGLTTRYEAITAMVPLQFETRANPETMSRGVSAMSFTHSAGRRRTVLLKHNETQTREEVDPANLPPEVLFSEDVADEPVDIEIIPTSRKRLITPDSEELLITLIISKLNKGQWKYLYEKLMKHTDSVSSEIKEDIKYIEEEYDEDNRQAVHAIQTWKQAYGRFDIDIVANCLKEIRRRDIAYSIARFIEKQSN